MNLRYVYNNISSRIATKRVHAYNLHTKNGTNLKLFSCQENQKQMRIEVVSGKEKHRVRD